MNLNNIVLHLKPKIGKHENKNPPAVASNIYYVANVHWNVSFQLC